MGFKLYSQCERYESDPRAAKIEEDIIELDYVTKYAVDLATPRTSLAKTYETKNEMTITLQIPKSDYKNENYQKILKWADLPVQDDDFYRDLAVNYQVAGDNFRTILFSHARITMKEHTTTKADYVTVELFVKQKEDQFAGVVLGEDLESTYEKAREKVNNPPLLNIVLPIPVDSDEDEDVNYAPGQFEIIVKINDKEIYKYRCTLSGDNIIYEFDTETTALFPTITSYIEGGYFIELQNSKQIIFNRYPATIYVHYSLQNEVAAEFGFVNETSYIETKKCGCIFSDDRFKITDLSLPLLGIALGYNSVTEKDGNWVFKIKNYASTYDGDGEIAIKKTSPIYVADLITALAEHRGCKIRDYKVDASNKIYELNIDIPVHDLKLVTPNPSNPKGFCYTMGYNGNIEIYDNDLFSDGKKGWKGQSINPRAFNGLYNKDYPWELKKVSLTAEDISSLEVSTKAINVKDTIQEERARLALDSIFFIVTTMLGYSEKWSEVAGAISAGSTITGIAPNMLVDVFKKEGVSIKNVSIEGRVDELEKRIYQTDEIRNATLMLVSSYTCHVIHVKDIRTNRYVPCCCTFAASHANSLIIGVRRRVNGILDNITILDNYSNYTASKHRTVGDALSDARIIKDWEAEVAKIIFAQTDGWYCYWDAGNPDSISASTADGRGDTRVKTHLLYPHFKSRSI